MHHNTDKQMKNSRASSGSIQQQQQQQQQKQYQLTSQQSSSSSSHTTAAASTSSQVSSLSSNNTSSTTTTSSASDKKAWHFEDFSNQNLTDYEEMCKKPQRVEQKSLGSGIVSRWVLPPDASSLTKGPDARVKAVRQQGNMTTATTSSFSPQQQHQQPTTPPTSTTTPTSPYSSVNESVPYSPHPPSHLLNLSSPLRVFQHQQQQYQEPLYVSSLYEQMYEELMGRDEAERIERDYQTRRRYRKGPRLHISIKELIWV